MHRNSRSQWIAHGVAGIPPSSRRFLNCSLIILLYALWLGGCATSPYDSTTKHCLSCHSEGEPTLAAGTQGGAGIVAPNHDHPIMTKYRVFAARTGYVPQPTLPLPNGRVTCISCHTPYVDPDQPHGGATVAKAQLCFGCHKL